MIETIVDEQTIIEEELALHDTRKKFKIYPLTLSDEARWINNTPELKASLEKKQKRLLRLSQSYSKQVEKIFADAKRRLSHDDYVLLSSFLTEFHPEVERLTVYVNRLLSINVVLTMAQNLMLGSHYGRKQIDIELQKQKDLQAAEILGIQLKKSGSVYKGLCPFHQEKTPSFTLYPNSHQFTCFGCGKSVDTIGLVMKIRQIRFVEALTFLERL